MKLALTVVLMLSPQLLLAGLDQYPALVRADAGPRRDDSIRVTYLGVNGYALEADGTVLLVDPYFTRASLPTIALNQPLSPAEDRIDAGLKHVADPVVAILVTHSHFDHLLDVPAIMAKKKEATLYADEAAVRLACAAGAPTGRARPVRANTMINLHPWKIHVLPAEHDRLPIVGKVPYSGKPPSGAKPEKAGDWLLGEPFAYLIEANGRRIYIESGGVPEQLPTLRERKGIDLAIISVALPDSRKRYAAAVKALQPRLVLPSHQDNMFRPAARGFGFGPLSSFTSVRRIHRHQKLPGELILLDYFRPWTIP